MDTQMLRGHADELLDALNEPDPAMKKARIVLVANSLRNLADAADSPRPPMGRREYHAA